MEIALRAAEGHPGGDIARVPFQAGFENLDRLNGIALAPEEFAELEKDPGRRIFPEQVAELLDSIIHRQLKGPGPGGPEPIILAQRPVPIRLITIGIGWFEAL